MEKWFDEGGVAPGDRGAPRPRCSTGLRDQPRIPPARRSSSAHRPGNHAKPTGASQARGSLDHRARPASAPVDHELPRQLPAMPPVNVPLHQPCFVTVTLMIGGVGSRGGAPSSQPRGQRLNPVRLSPTNDPCQAAQRQPADCKRHEKPPTARTESTRQACVRNGCRRRSATACAWRQLTAPAGPFRDHLRRSL